MITIDFDYSVLCYIAVVYFLNAYAWYYYGQKVLYCKYYNSGIRVPYLDKPNDNVAGALALLIVVISIGAMFTAIGWIHDIHNK